VFTGGSACVFWHDEQAFVHRSSLLMARTQKKNGAKIGSTDVFVSGRLPLFAASNAATMT